MKWYPSYRAHAKKAPRRGGSPIASAIRWVVALFLTLYLSWLLLFPARSGSLGIWLSRILFRLLGNSAYLLPLFLVNGLIHYFKKKTVSWTPIALGSLLCLFALAAVGELIGPSMGLALEAAGGAAGVTLERYAYAAVGGFGTFVLCSALVLFSLQTLLEIRWSKALAWFVQAIVSDYRAWQRSRRELAHQLAEATAGTATLAPEPVAPAALPPTPSPARKEKVEPQKPAPAAPPPPPDSPYARYQQPSVQLLRPAPAQDLKPQEAEILAAIADLEKTLKDFDIDAKVTGYAPGPVITRYEVSPAPGVKVSSIVQLSNDIALAMRAKGIRIIAPIPGKAAVGIEIPNHRPALVVLRQILESPALGPHAAKLSFAVGLSSDGQPLAADLQKMPHLLVAGATNSGKSVLIHSLILSILFRARPDEVKFLLIDPKRLELTFYDGIPHLFDPMTPSDKVGVVTNPKDAAKSLTAMVRVMERRYEKFQLWGVRNIDSYNQEADRRKQPREFFIVVVIDELADLMLVSQDAVEDSIQRLAQMARAVGIHLVLATQRPSVDVITGVIKANLTTRIALQVISKVDSKVILDSVGAESLLGKGDLLYLGAGSQKPERCQGAYVTEEEINKAAEALRAMGKPSYPMLETMAAGGSEADLKSYGVEPLEFSQALKLVLERRRVSQDLLKSQFGSSARATNLLSLLEVKQMIHKPEGTNRWEINFDLIEDYLRKHFPQVPIDRKE